MEIAACPSLEGVAVCRRWAWSFSPPHALRHLWLSTLPSLFLFFFLLLFLFISALFVLNGSQELRMCQNQFWCGFFLIYLMHRVVPLVSGFLLGGIIPYVAVDAVCPWKEVSSRASILPSWTGTLTSLFLYFNQLLLSVLLAYIYYTVLLHNILHV